MGDEHVVHFVWLQSFGFYGTVALAAAPYLTKTAPIDMLRSEFALSGAEQIVSVSLIAAPALFLISLLLGRVYGFIMSRHIQGKREELGIEPMSIRGLVDSGLLHETVLLPSFLTFPFRFFWTQFSLRSNSTGIPGFSLSAFGIRLRWLRTY